MISFFRRIFSSKLGAVFAVLFILLIGLAFALADINAPGGMFAGDGQTIATVGDEDMDDETVRSMMTRALQNAREEQPGIDMNAFVENEGLDRAIEQRARDIALSNFADEHSLLVSKRLIDSIIADIPAFQGLTGAFDENTFRQVLAQQSITEDEIRGDLRRQTLNRLILGPVTAAAFVPEAIARPFASLLLERRSGQIAAIPSQAMGEGEPPTAAELNAFYQENTARYTLPERRAIRYAVFTRDQVNVPEPTDEQIREYYEDNSDEYGGSETRTLRQIILPDEAAARAFYQEVNGGTSFAAAATERGFSESATSLANQTRDGYQRATNRAIATAAFSGDEGDLLEPQRSGLGWHVVQIASINSRNQTSLASVRGEITNALREELANEALAEFYLAIENGIEDGGSFEEVVEAQGLTIVATPPVAPSGMSPEQPEFRPSPDLAPVLEAAFTMTQDEDPIVVAIEQDQRYAMVDVTSIARSAPQALSRIRPLVTRDFVLDRAATRARAVADSIVEAVNGGTSLAEAVSAVDVDLPAPQSAQATRAQLAQMGANVPAPLRLLFRMAENTAKLVRLPDNQGWFVVALEEITSTEEEISDELIAQTQQQFSQITAGEYGEQFTNAVLADYPLTRDEEAIAAFADRLTGRAN